MEFQKINAPTIKELFVQQIQEKILSGEFKPGDRLPPERELAAQMKISPSVVNSGFQELSRLGFVEIKPRHGTFIADYKRNGIVETLNAVFWYSGQRFDKKILENIFDFRSYFEPICSEIAAKNRSEENLQELRNILKQMEDTDDPELLSEYSYNFHHIIMIGTGNIIYPLLFTSFRKIYISLYNLGYVNLPKSINYDHFVTLFHLIEKKDSDGAKHYVRDKMIPEGWKFLSENCTPGEKYPGQ